MSSSQHLDNQSFYCEILQFCVHTYNYELHKMVTISYIYMNNCMALAIPLLYNIATHICKLLDSLVGVAVGCGLHTNCSDVLVDNVL